MIMILKIYMKTMIYYPADIIDGRTRMIQSYLVAEAIDCCEMNKKIDMQMYTQTTQPLTNN